MTVRQMQVEFGIQMNQMGDALVLHTKDILYWLNKSQEKFIIDQFAGKVKNSAGFETSQEITDNLRSLVVPNEELDSSGYALNVLDSFSMDMAYLPTTYLFTLNIRVKAWINNPLMEYVTTSGNRTPEPNKQKRSRVLISRFVQWVDVWKTLSDPFSTTSQSSPLHSISGNNILVYTDKTFIVDKVIIDYIRKAKELVISNPTSSQTTTCELPEHTHKEIVELAVNLFLQNTRDLKQRLQLETPSSETKNEEQQ